MKLAPVREAERVEPRPVERSRVGRGAGEELPQRGDDEDRRGRGTGWPSRMFWIRSPISTPRQLTQVIEAMKTTPVAVTSGTLSASRASSERAHDPVDQRPEVDAGDLGEVGEHDHSGDGDAPAAHPADPGSERLRAPREGRSAVGDLVVELAIGEGDEQHRDEGEDEHDRRLRAHGQHDEAQRRDERVDRRGRGESDDRGSPQSERACCESLAFGSVEVYRSCSHM